MRLFIRRRLPLVATLALLLAGGTVAAMAAGGNLSSHGHRASPHHHGNASPSRGRRILQTAASYIGTTPEVVEQGLASGKSLGQLATEAGKSEAGLVQALASAARPGLEERIAQAVKQPGAGLRGMRRHAHRLRIAAAAYLGLTPAALRAQLHAGRTLAQIADATPGHSRAALIDAIVAARLAQAPERNLLRPAGKRSASSKARATRIRRRVTTLVDRVRLAQQAPPAGG